MVKGKRRLTGIERRQQILEKATEVFAAHGLDGTKTRDLAKECGINESLLYKHFSSKEDLYHEAMILMHDRMSASWRALATEESSNVGAIRESLAMACAFFTQNPQTAANILRGVAASPHAPEMMTQSQEWFLSYHKYFRGQLENGRNEGIIKPDLDLDAASFCFMGISWLCIISQVINLEDWHHSMNPEKMMHFILGDSPDIVVPTETVMMEEKDSPNVG
jgi:AcrR family transcriptional regulator